mmetsp:Transcript_12321/g.18491  ORF Transcript_12321/g.18491 Transcript_12321/m.18491 type:complete len:271 (+) Transcript_12321:74-886(+)
MKIFVRICLLISVVHGYVVGPVSRPLLKNRSSLYRGLRPYSSGRVRIAVASSQIDLDSPEVAKEYEKVKELSIYTVKKELDDLGIPYDVAMMSEMDMKLRLMEARVRLSAPPKQKRKAPGPNASKYEKLIYENPAVKKFVDELMEIGDINRANAFTEYIDNEKVARQRYGNSQLYLDIFDKAEELKNAPAFTSRKLEFKGFPSAMGEDMIKISLEEFGTLKAFSVKIDDTSPECSGVVEYESQESADSAVAKWDGADMGMGSKLSLEYVE